MKFLLASMAASISGSTVGYGLFIMLISALLQAYDEPDQLFGILLLVFCSFIALSFVVLDVKFGTESIFYRLFD